MILLFRVEVCSIALVRLKMNFSCRILRWLIDEDDLVNESGKTKIQFLIVEMSRKLFSTESSLFSTS